MPKKRVKQPPKAVLVSKLIKFPSDWVERIDASRGEAAFAEFVRSAVLAQIDSQGLSEFPGWGGDRQK